MTNNVASFRSHISVELKETMGGEYSIINAARISLGTDGTELTKDSELTKRDYGILHRLFVDYHGTPFEKATFQFKIEAPLFVIHQLQRHRWSSFNEQSGRYTEFKSVFYLPEKFRKQTGKRMDYIYEDFDPGSDESFIINGEYIEACLDSWDRYQILLKSGVAMEHARMVLPTSIFTAAVWDVNVRSLSNFLFLRLDPHAQGEIQELSKQLYTFFEEKLPYVATLYKEIAQIRPEFDLYAE